MRSPSFRLFDLAAVLLLVFLLFVLTVPVGVEACASSRRMTNSTQLRGIHQGLVTYANSKKNWFPGINMDGENEGITIEMRFQSLLLDDFITPEYANSPRETEPITEWDPGTSEPVNPVTAGNYSYAMLQIPDEGGRRDEWFQTLNSQAIVLSDRNTGPQAMPSSIHVEDGDDWAGSVLWNDNHVGFENEDVFETRYGGPPDAPNDLNPEDRLFEAKGADDALMIHSGN